MAETVTERPRHVFDYQAPDEAQTERIRQARTACKDLFEVLVSVAPSCRERSLAITKLEEVSMWINKAIVFTELE